VFETVSCKCRHNVGN